MRAVTRGKKAKKPKGASNQSMLDKHARVYHDPMVSIRDPKILDGSCVESLGRQKRDVNRLNIPSEFEGFIFLQPGATCPMYCAAVQDTSQASFDIALKTVHGDTATQNFSYPDTGVDWTTNGVDNLAGANNEASFSNTTPSVYKWRIVSSGVKCSLMNSTDTNGGFFEVRHFHVRPDERNFVLLPTDKTEINTGFNNQQMAASNIMVPSPRLMEALATNFDANDSSYYGGSLADINKFDFHEGTTATDEKWTTMRGEYNVRLDSFAAGTGVRGYQKLDRGTDTLQFVQDNFDFNYTWTVIHVLPNTSGTTRLQLETSTNYEIVYTDLAELNELHTASPMNRRHLQHQNTRRRRLTKAAFRRRP